MKLCMLSIIRCIIRWELLLMELLVKIHTTEMELFNSVEPYPLSFPDRELFLSLS